MYPLVIIENPCTVVGTLSYLTVIIDRQLIIHVFFLKIPINLQIEFVMCAAVRTICSGGLISHSKVWSQLF